LPERSVTERARAERDPFTSVIPLHAALILAVLTWSEALAKPYPA
jgi:hypothetical protein